MTDLELIPHHQKTRVLFSPEPAYNVLCSCWLLNTENLDFRDWVAQTARKLSPQILQTNLAVCGPAATYLNDTSWPSFPAWLDDLSERDPEAMIQRDMEYLLIKARIYVGESHTLPSVEQLIDDREVYLSVYESIKKVKNYPFDREAVAAEYHLIRDPAVKAKRKEEMVNHLRMMWDEHLAPEWERVQPMLRDSLAAFESLDFTGLSTAETLRQIIGREHLPADWENWFPSVGQIIFIPSAHIGPHMMVMDMSETTVWVIDRARIPEGATVSSPALSRSELQMRLRALSDDTRLGILELLAREGAMNAKEIKESLDLSQSAVSRHLNQLTATGYLNVRRQDGANVCSVNTDRIDSTYNALKRFLR